jgi:hypothetical protein
MHLGIFVGVEKTLRIKRKGCDITQNNFVRQDGPTGPSEEEPCPITEIAGAIREAAVLLSKHHRRYRDTSILYHLPEKDTFKSCTWPSIFLFSWYSKCFSGTHHLAILPMIEVPA